MISLRQDLERRLGLALDVVLGGGHGVVPCVTPANDLRFGDYQSNVAMVTAKNRGRNPRELATALTGAIDLAGVGTAEIAGPGFINFRIAPGCFAARAGEMLADERLGVPAPGAGRRLVIDFSAPNIAKPMHVGHIRSTIIGDCLARVARLLGYQVITDNHIGDWGTQFGMILHGWKSILDHDALAADPVAELLRVYREVNSRAKADEAVLAACKQELVKLQQGDAGNMGIWEKCVELSKEGLRRIYARLDVSFDHWHGESFYNDRLAPLVDEFLAKGLARVSDGAVCVFSDGGGPPEGDPFKIHREDGWADNPAIIRKGDGGFLYATSDLATIDFRVAEWGADEIWYVVGVPQQLHFRQIFNAAARWGRRAEFHHVAFGSILGEDRKLMKTRSGENVQLGDVLDEAVERAAVIAAKSPTLDERERAEVAEIVGIGAVKFAELSQHRLTDYVFGWDKMLALTGDTAPYLLYSHVRIRAIFRKLGEGSSFSCADAAIVLGEDEEVTLARLLCRFGEVVPGVLDGFRPNLLAGYLLEVARAFHSFFEACPVLRAETATRDSRLALCELTSRVLARGLGLLGIRVPERM